MGNDIHWRPRSRRLTLKRSAHGTRGPGLSPADLSIALPQLWDVNVPAGLSASAVSRTPLAFQDPGPGRETVRGSGELVGQGIWRGGLEAIDVVLAGQVRSQ